MPHGFTQPAVVMAATCPVICVSPWMNGDLRDMRPSPGSACGGRSGSASVSTSSWGHTHGNLRYVCVHVCVNAYVSAFLGNDKRSWLPQDHVVTAGTTTTATAAAASGAVDQLLLHLKTALQLAACKGGTFLFVLQSRSHFSVWWKD